MQDGKLLKDFEPGHGFSREDWDAVSDTPELTEDDFRRAKPFREALPDLAASIEIGRSDDLVRVDMNVLRKFQAEGDDWEVRINAVLRKAAGL